MRCILKKQQITKNLFNLRFFFFKLNTNFIFNLNGTSFFLKKQLLLLNSVLNETVCLNKRFLIIDDLNSVSYNFYNFFIFNEMVFFFKYLKFIYSRNKTKKLFHIYLLKLIKKKNIKFFLFINEEFFFRNQSLFNKIKISKIGFISKQHNHKFLDYALYIPSHVVFTQFFIFYFLYDILRLSYLSRNKFFQTKFIKNI